MVRTLLASMLILAQVAQAQIALPAVRLPGLPPVGLPADLEKTVAGVANDLSPNRLQDLRRLAVLDLIRSHPTMIEADPHGAAMIRSEVLAFSPSAATLDRALSAGFSVVRERTLDGLDARIVVLRAPDGMSTRRALKRLRALDPSGSYDFNHLYADSGVGPAPAGAAQTRGALDGAFGPSGARPGPSGTTAAGAGPNAMAAAAADPNATAGAGSQPDVGARLGLIDGGVDVAHPVFRDIVIHQHGCAGAQVPGAHGTEVASLMIGRSSRFHGAAPGSDLYAADVYCGQPTGGAVDAVADSFAWLVRERVPVINVSLVGPPNVMLESVVRLVIARGHVVVAAVGNDGPAAPPLYPAAYPDVVGVTGVDARQKVLVEAGRGRQVKFAAPGADMAAANPSQAYALVRGTSFAAPIVAGLLATQMRQPDKAAAQQAVADLARTAVDLGAPGPDPVYGYGLVGGNLRPEPALASLRAE